VGIEVVDIQRVSATDLMELVCDVSGTSMQVAAVLKLAAPRTISLVDLRRELSDRIESVPRLRQRLMDSPLGCGRPIWVDDATFDIADHVTEVCCTAPGDEQALLKTVAGVITTRLPIGRPLWSATFVTGLSDDRSALVIVFHHVLADGIGGLAILEHLADGRPGVPDPDFPRPVPSHREMFLDGVLQRVAVLRRLPAGVRRLRAGAAELGNRSTPGTPAARHPSGDVRRKHSTGGSLNRPIGTGRALAVARVDLDAVRAAAHARGGTVNDVVVTAAAGALRQILAARGEHVEQLVISMPVSDRRRTSATELGNHVGVLPIPVPLTSDAAQRLEAVAAITRTRKTSAPGASASLISLMFRFLARLGVFGWFIAHQHLINTFVSNLRGPERRMSLLGNEIIEITPVAMISGNVTVAFTALSYSGVLTVTVVADPQRCPEYQAVGDALQRELDVLTTTG